MFKNSTNLLSSLAHLGVLKATFIQTFDFSTLYTSIPHDLVKSRMDNIIKNTFKVTVGPKQSAYRNLKQISLIECMITVILQLAIENGFSGHYISAQAEAGFSLLFQ